MSLFPIREHSADASRSVRLVDVSDERDGKVLEPLSSETARQVVGAVKEQPQPASDIAESVDSSIQNVRYHLETLASAGLVETVDTWYSETGREMDVYAPTHEALVVLTGPERRSVALEHVLGAAAIVLGLVAVASGLIARFVPEPRQMTYFGAQEFDTGLEWYQRPELAFLAGGAFALLLLAAAAVVLARR